MDKPQKIDALTQGVLMVACGLYHTACLVDNFDVYTWGNNFQGQLGTPKGILTKKRPNPEAIGELRGRVCNYIACGSNNTIALTETGDIWGWGNNAYYKNGVDEVLTAPERLSLGKDTMKPVNYTQRFAEQFQTLGEPRQILKSVRLANEYTMGYTDKGNYYVWGKYWGRKGIDYSKYDSNKNSSKFFGLFKLDLDISSATDTEGLDLNRSRVAPDLNTSGLGYKKSKMEPGLTHDLHKLSEVGGDEYREHESSCEFDQFTRVACGGNFSLAMTIKGRVFVWGSNANSEHGTDTEYIVTEYEKWLNDKKVKIPAAFQYVKYQVYPHEIIDFGPSLQRRVTNIAAGAKHCVAIVNNKMVLTWGDNSKLQSGFLNPDKFK